MGDSPLAAGIDPAFTSQVQEYLTEATTGPAKGGIVGQVTIAGVTLEAAASRDWGVQFSRTLPDGRTKHRRLEPGQATLAGAGAAIGELLRA